MCGSMRECVHDDDESEQFNNSGSPKRTAANVAASRRTPGTSYDVDDCYEMVSCAAIMPGSEVYNTYGDKLDNAQLLVQYGFLLEGNENDRITFDREELEELVESPAERRRATELWKRIYEEWRDEFRERLVSDSRLVHGEGLGPDRNRESAFELNGEGKVGDGLWIFCSLMNLKKNGASWIEEVIEVLGRMVDLQMVAEKEIGMRDEEADGGAALFGNTPDDYGARRRQRAGRLREENQTDFSDRASSSSPTKTMGTMMQAMVTLCEAKKGKLGRPGADLATLGEVADHLPEYMKRTRLAIAQVMAEYSILSACQSGWSELASVALGPWEDV